MDFSRGVDTILETFHNLYQFGLHILSQQQKKSQSEIFVQNQENIGWNSFKISENQQKKLKNSKKYFEKYLLDFHIFKKYYFIVIKLATRIQYHQSLRILSHSSHISGHTFQYSSSEYTDS